MKIFLSKLYVEDQKKALAFYTEKLGFEKKADIENSGYRWLTVVSPNSQQGPELLLEANSNPAAKAYQQALKADSYPANIFEVEDIAAEHTRLTGLGVSFTMPPTDIGPTIIAILDDTCGNLIQLNQPK